MKSNGTYHWSPQRLEEGMCIEDAIAHFRDGRNLASMFAKRFAKEHNLHFANGKGASLDMFPTVGWDARWTPRIMTDGGVYFGPQKMIGCRRKFHVSGLKEKFQDLNGFVIADAESFPNVPYWIIGIKVIQDWHAAGLVKIGRISRSKFLALV